MTITTRNTPAEGANPLVDHPAHYNQHQSGVECIDIIRHHNFNTGTVIKHLWRAGFKDENPTLQDLEKAAWYLADEIKRVHESEKLHSQESFTANPFFPEGSLSGSDQEN